MRAVEKALPTMTEQEREELKAEQNKWRRFELVTADLDQIHQLNDILGRGNLDRYELAVIVASLRVRPGFSLEDFRV